jgi:hypothetical protein
MIAEVIVIPLFYLIQQKVILMFPQRGHPGLDPGSHLKLAILKFVRKRF